VLSNRKELYRSPNGDCWYLARDSGTGHGFIIHEPNTPSGGKVLHIEIGSFLRMGGTGPEHQALLRLIGSFVEAPEEATRT
jgi:hypothetical protein